MCKGERRHHGRKPKLAGHQRREAIARREAGEVLIASLSPNNVSHSRISLAGLPLANLPANPGVTSEPPGAVAGARLPSYLTRSGLIPHRHRCTAVHGSSTGTQTQRLKITPKFAILDGIGNIAHWARSTCLEAMCAFPATYLMSKAP